MGVVSHDRTAQAGLDGYGHRLGQKHLARSENTLRDLNYQLKQICRRNKDGTFTTQRDRVHRLAGPGAQRYTCRFTMHSFIHQRTSVPTALEVK